MGKISSPLDTKQQLILGSYAAALDARLKAWNEEDIASRIWRRDGAVWMPDPEKAARTTDPADRLGWLTIPETMLNEVKNLTAFAEEIREEGYNQVVLLGMGGSSLAPEVLMTTFGNAPGFPSLIVLDSTHPTAVQRVSDSIDVKKTLFLVSSKSGGTIETLSFFKFFYDAVSAAKNDPGQNFVAITDPGSRLETLAADKKLRRVFSSPPEVGGRYSALTYFGLVPAALIGLDLREFLNRSVAMAQATCPGAPVADNPGLSLGAAIGELALAGRDKITFFASPGISAFGIWLEQLIAESTGKLDTGILPVADEEPAGLDNYGDDRVFVHLRLSGDNNEALDRRISALQKGGHPVILISLDKRGDIGGEFFRWEMATASAGAVLGINPFDQPNVEAAKVKARDLMAAYHESGSLPADMPVLTDGCLEVHGGTGRNTDTAVALLKDFIKQARPGDYVALMAYIPPTDETDRALNIFRLNLRDRLKTATTVGYGPRFLHSTGQLHKGDGNKGLFIQITHTPEADTPIPGEPYSFGTLIAAQALGDYQALQERGRRLIRFHIGADLISGLNQLKDALL